MSQPIVYLNGEYLPQDQAKISVMDRGFLLADGIYEVTPLYHGKPFHLKEHHQRFQNSLNAIHITPPLSEKDIADIIKKLCEHNGTPEMGSIYLQVTRGASDARRGFEQPAKPTIFAFLQTTDPRIIHEGAKTILINEFRWSNCDIKGINRLANTLMYRQVAEAGFDEAIIINEGFATECASSNIAIIEGDRFITPPLSKKLLPGITRQVVLKLAEEIGLTVVERDIPKAALFTADEVLLTASNKEVSAITHIDGTLINNGQPGKWAKKLNQAYEAYVKKHCA